MTNKMQALTAATESFEDTAKGKAFQAMVIASVTSAPAEMRAVAKPAAKADFGM